MRTINIPDINQSRHRQNMKTTSPLILFVILTFLLACGQKSIPTIVDHKKVTYDVRHDLNSSVFGFAILLDSSDLQNDFSGRTDFEVKYSDSVILDNKKVEDFLKSKPKTNLDENGKMKRPMLCRCQLNEDKTVSVIFSPPQSMFQYTEHVVNISKDTVYISHKTINCTSIDTSTNDLIELVFKSEPLYTVQDTLYGKISFRDFRKRPNHYADVSGYFKCIVRGNYP